MFWNFILGVGALVVRSDNRQATFLYSFQLLSIISLFKTMKLVVDAIIDRINQYVATFALLLVMVWFFSSIAFYFLRPNYIIPDIDENVCSTYLKCLLTYFNDGIKWGGTDNNTIISAYEDPYYFAKFFFDWFYFFTINLVLLNTVNAIIVDTFQTYREEQSKRDYQEKNVCYICSLSRAKFEIDGHDFVKHIKNEHSLENYIYFLIGIRFDDEHHLNSLQFKILKEMSKIQFFPIKRGMIFEENK